MRFQFTRPSEPDYCGPDKLYQPNETSEYGFLTETNRNADKRLQIPELNDGFQEVFWLDKSPITSILGDESGAYVDYAGQGEIPLTFAADVASEGNYKIRIKLYASQDVKELLIFTGRRRLAYIGSLQEGEVLIEDFITNICPIIPRGMDRAMEDLTCDITVLGRGVHLMELEITEWAGRTLYIAGDSTVTDQTADYPYLPGASYCGWGQMISCYAGQQMAVSNHSHSGLTTESFRSEGHYQILIDRIKENDICLFQYGHNDQKLMNLKSDEGYRQNLTRYINEIKAKGAIPVIISPLARNSWKNEAGAIVYNDLLQDYQVECKRLAAEFQVPYVELHNVAMERIIKEGRDSAKRFFFPSDYTHSNDYGALLFASYVYGGLVKAGLMQDKLLKGWQPPKQIELLEIPEECRNMKPADAVEILTNIERPGDELTRVEAMDFIIQTCKFFPTNVYNDMFTDVIGHETYAGTVETAYQNGMIPEEMVENGQFLPAKAITKREFLISLMQGYSSRKSLSGANPDMLQEALALGITDDSKLDETISRGVAAEICRQINV